MYQLIAQKMFKICSVALAMCTWLMVLACGSEVGLAEVEGPVHQQALRPLGQKIILHGAYRIGGVENNSWRRFHIKGRQNEDGIDFKRHILLDRSGSSLLIDYRFKNASTGSYHPSFQGGMWITNARDGNLNFEIDAELNLGRAYGPGYAMSVARLELRSGKNGGVLESLAETALTEVDYGQDIHFDLFPAPFMIISEGPGEIYKWDFKVGPYPEEEFLFNKIGKIGISHAFVQGPDTELEMLSWNWLTLLSP